MSSSAAPTSKRTSEAVSDSEKTSGKRSKIETPVEKESSTAASESTDPYPGYYHDAASGWYINNTAPEWQFNPTTSIHYNATEAQFYRQDPVTQEFKVVEYDPNAPQEQEHEQAEPEILGLGKGELLPHFADYTFMQGRRPTQEDRHTIIHDFGKKLRGLDVKASFYAVFDGHSGDQCSEHISKTLHTNLATKLITAGNPLTKESVTRAIKETCAATDKEFLRIAKIRKRTDGCCCIAVLLLESTLFVINIGDSRAVLASDGVGKALSNDHKPEREDEKKRIENAGGSVINFGDCWRITPPEFYVWDKQKIKQGPRPIQPAVARSFGDITLKVPRQLMVCTPEITVVDLTGKDTHVLLGCDGIWDVLSDQVAVTTAIKAGNSGKDAKGIAGSVVKLAYERGSTDNISVVAILLHKSVETATKKK
eukprot:m.27643 g.27643  ORF g.27643 m.27643 type:complete len:424 (+) comp15781_c0_seq1:220-1491(+)